METNTITEKEINLIKMRLNNDKVDEATQEVIDYIWDNSPQLTPDQNKKGIDYLGVILPKHSICKGGIWSETGINAMHSKPRYLGT
jgi:hypothetical protein